MKNAKPITLKLYYTGPYGKKIPSNIAIPFNDEGLVSNGPITEVYFSVGASSLNFLLFKYGNVYGPMYAENALYVLRQFKLLNSETQKITTVEVYQ